MKIASFDIFDTTLIRKCGKPQNIFYLLAQKLFCHNAKLQKEFVIWRLNIESKISFQTKCEIMLNDIYNNFPEDKFGYSGAFAMESELQVERDNLVANSTIKETIRSKRKAGFKIMFISDMYLPSAFLKECLMHNHCILPNEEVFVSCENQARKSDGTLYDKISNIYHPKDWWHYGDNKNSDVNIPKQKGINSQFVDTTFTPIENKLIKEHDNFDASILVGYLRCARLAVGDSCYSRFASDYIAPIFLSYVQYIIKDCEKKNIKRIYFLSRDSYMFYKIAQSLFPSSSIEFKYLFVSRKSLLVASQYEHSKKELLDSFGRKSFCGVDKKTILKSLKFDLKEYVKNTGDDKIGLIKNTNDEKFFLSYIFNEKNMHQMDLENHLLEEYLKQEGFLDDLKMCIVDLGWLGTTRVLLNRIRRHNHLSDVHTYYWMVFKNVLSDKYGSYTSFVQNEKVVTLAHLLEKYLALSPYSSTYGYVRKRDKVFPVFGKNNTIFDENVLEANLKSLVFFAKLIKSNGYSNANALICDMSNSLIENLLTFNTKFDFSPFFKLADNEYKEGDILLKHFTFGELLKYVFGKRITMWDNGSLNFTYNRHVAAALYMIRHFIAKFK